MLRSTCGAPYRHLSLDALWAWSPERATIVSGDSFRDRCPFVCDDDYGVGKPRGCRFSAEQLTDGARVYAYFANAGLFVFDMKGKPIWSRPMPAPRMRSGWGAAASGIGVTITAGPDGAVETERHPVCAQTGVTQASAQPMVQISVA